jgi:hypothetical protein
VKPLYRATKQHGGLRLLSKQSSLPIGLSGTREVHGNTVDRGVEEAWSAFVSRAGAETSTYIQAFRLTEVVDKGEVYFNVVWVREADFDKLTQLSANGCNGETSKTETSS